MELRKPSRFSCGFVELNIVLEEIRSPLQTKPVFDYCSALTQQGYNTRHGEVSVFQRGMEQPAPR